MSDTDPSDGVVDATLRTTPYPPARDHASPRGTEERSEPPFLRSPRTEPARPHGTDRIERVSHSPPTSSAPNALPLENCLQHQTKRNVRCNIRIKSIATLEQRYCNNRTKVLQREMQDQKKETNATKKYYLLQQRLYICLPIGNLAALTC